MSNNSPVIKFDVLDKGWVELIDIMPYPASGVLPELAIVNAARTSVMGESKGQAEDSKLLRYLYDHKHTTPFEMVEFKFMVKAPDVVWRHWFRHRTMSYNSQSFRYTEAEKEEFYIPDVWRKQSETNKQGSDGVLFSGDNALTNSLAANHNRCFELYESALSVGVAREQARLFLPNLSLYSVVVVKVNAHNLMRFLRLRMAEDAQWEIRQYADCIYENIFKQTMPNVYEWMKE